MFRRKGSIQAGSRVGDKVRLKGGVTEPRGVISAVDGQSAIVKLASGSMAVVSLLELTNFSLAARQTWITRPHRAVGRPRGCITQRTSVTLRIDRSLWDRFRALERHGVIDNRGKWFHRLLESAVGKTEEALSG